MKPLSWPWLVLYGAVAAFLSATLSFISLTLGGSPATITPFLALLQLLLAALVLWAGHNVRRYKAGKKTWVNALLAMRVAIAARASAIVSSLIVGAVLGIFVTSLARVSASAMAANAVASGLACVAGLAWCVSAVLVERWCLVDGDEDTDHRDPQSPSVSAA